VCVCVSCVMFSQTVWVMMWKYISILLHPIPYTFPQERRFSSVHCASMNDVSRLVWSKSYSAVCVLDVRKSSEIHWRHPHIVLMCGMMTSETELPIDTDTVFTFFGVVLCHRYSRRRQLFQPSTSVYRLWVGWVIRRVVRMKDLCVIHVHYLSMRYVWSVRDSMLLILNLIAE